MDSLVFASIEPITIAFEFEDRPGDKYELREAVGEATMAWRNAMFDASDLDEAGKAKSFKGLADSDFVLLSHCVYRCRKDNPDIWEKMSYDSLLKWPERVLSNLIDKLKQISEIGKYRSKKNEDGTEEENPTLQAEQRLTTDGQK